MTLTIPLMKTPGARWCAALLLPLALLAGCSRGDAGGSEASAGDVDKAAWAPANLTEVQGVPVAALRSAIEQRLTGQRPATVGEEAWKHTQRLYKRFGQTPLWLTTDGLEKERAGALTDAVLNANADALKLDEYPITELANALVELRRAPKPTAEQLTDVDVLLTATYASLGEDLLTGYVEPRSIAQSWHIDPEDENVDSALVRTLARDTAGQGDQRDASERSRLRGAAEGAGALSRHRRQGRLAARSRRQGAEDG